MATNFSGVTVGSKAQFMVTDREKGKSSVWVAKVVNAPMGFRSVRAKDVPDVIDCESLKFTVP